MRWPGLSWPGSAWPPCLDTPASSAQSGTAAARSSWASCRHNKPGGGNNLSSHSIPISHYYSLVSAASSVAWPRRLLRSLRLASIATCGLGAISTGRPLAGQLIRPGAVSAHRAGPVTTRSCGGRIIWSLLPLLNLPRLADADSTARTTNIRTV